MGVAVAATAAAATAYKTCARAQCNRSYALFRLPLQHTSEDAHQERVIVPWKSHAYLTFEWNCRRVLLLRPCASAASGYERARKLLIGYPKACETDRAAAAAKAALLARRFSSVCDKVTVIFVFRPSSLLFIFFTPAHIKNTRHIKIKNSKRCF
jgi:hypothetical protein